MGLFLEDKRTQLDSAKVDLIQYDNEAAVSIVNMTSQTPNTNNLTRKIIVWLY